MNYLKKDLESHIKELFRQWADCQSKEKLSKIRYSGPSLGAEEYEAMLDAVFSNWWSGGKYTIEAERKLSEISSRKKALLTNSGSSANLLLLDAVKHLYLKDGDKVLTLSCGFPTTLNPILQVGLHPVLVDIDADTLNLSPDVLKNCIAEHDIKLIFVAHTLGFGGKVDDILKIAKENDILVCFDSCDAYGTQYKGKPIQSYGLASTMSFYAAHHCTMGEGGAIVTDNEQLWQVMRGMRNWGRYCASDECCIRSTNPEAFCPEKRLSKETNLPEDYPVNQIYEWIGYNLKPLELQSAILSVQLDKLGKFTEIRRKNYELLYNELAYLNKNTIGLHKLNDGESPFSFPICLNVNHKRKDFVDHLKKNKIESRVLFAGNLSRHPAYEKSNMTIFKWPHNNSDIITEYVVIVGISHVNGEDETMKIASAIKEFMNEIR